MATTTQYNPNQTLNKLLLNAGTSKTVYALVTPETEAAKNAVLGSAVLQLLTLAVQTLFGQTAKQLCDLFTIDAARAAHLEQFREAWTNKQDKLHKEFFDVWHQWSAPLIDLDRDVFKFSYPTGGASEPLRHLIYDYGNIARVENLTPRVHVFKGEYEGFKAYAEAAKIEVIEHDRNSWKNVAANLPDNEWFFLSQPSAIDGNVWHEANAFLRIISAKSQKPQVIMDMTYVGAIASAPPEKFAVSEPCVRNVVFSLSKPFGVYYDRIGGIWSRTEDLGLFGNTWFKSLMAIQFGTKLMRRHDVFDLPRRYKATQLKAANEVSRKLGIAFKPADIFMLATAEMTAKTHPDLADYLRRPSHDQNALLRLCLTPSMAKTIGTTGPVRKTLKYILSALAGAEP